MKRARQRRSAPWIIASTVAISSVVVGAAAPAAATPSTFDGLTPANAAASCWEVKQQHSASADGVYWLRNDALQRPEQFYCDMTTDGGGWVLIGRGREGWTFREYGQLTPAMIRGEVEGPAAFAPGALSTELIDGLLNGGDVKDLVDGVRLRRARNKQGTQWQDVRWKFLDLTSWSWAFGGGHRLAEWEIDGSGGTGSNTADSQVRKPGEVGNGNRGGTGRRAWFTFPWSGHGNAAGFSYGRGIDGENNSTSYLWERNTENNAIPFTQVFIRPRLTTPALPAIPASGLPADTLTPIADDRPAELSGGVWGVLKSGDSEPQVDAPVLAIQTLGNRVFVGGKFSQVRDAASGNLVDHPYLAAFDRTTGQWIPSFDPDLDGTVWDLLVADGRLIVAGQFTNIDGVANTAALAAIDPQTGAVDPNWRAGMTLSGSSARPLARALDLAGGWIYVGGNFTSIAGPNVTRSMGRMGRVAVATGDPDAAFRPDIGGVPYDVDTDAGRTYIVGDFATVNGQDQVGVAVVDAGNGGLVPGLADPVWTTANLSRRYQQAVLAVGSQVWQGGSEHNTHVYNTADYALVRSHVTHNRGGDTQAFDIEDGFVYQGSHGNAWTYTDAIEWPSTAGYTRVDDYKWVGAYDVVNHEYAKGFAPSLHAEFDEGVWTLHADDRGCIWFGGDIRGGPFVNGQRQYLEGFSRFCQRDTTPPTVPTNGAVGTLNDGGVQLVWSQSSDDRPGFIGYEILRNDRVVSPLVYGSSYVDPSGTAGDRYFIRAVDPAGNRSATTAQIVPGDNSPPSTPQDLTATIVDGTTVELEWSASTDDTGVTEYLVLRNGVEIATVPAPAGPTVATTITDVPQGSSWFQVRARDAAGNESFKTPPVRVDLDGPDTQRPSTPQNLTAVYNEATQLIDVEWLASADNVGVTGYVVRRNLAEVATVAGDVTSTSVDLGAGDHYIQVEAVDAAGNTSFRTAPVLVSVASGVDTSRPSIPRDFTAVAEEDGSITVGWSASTDNVGVTGYEILRNGTVVDIVDGMTTTANVTGLGSGDHYMQVRATDAAGNLSGRTAPILVTVAAGDDESPSTPRNVTAEVNGTDIIVSWDPSSDNVGVSTYRVLRNLVEVATTDGATTSVVVSGLGPGDHYMQVQALDAAGNASFRSPPVLVTL